jgi:hypothetical protein
VGDQDDSFLAEVKKKLVGFSEESIFNAYRFREESTLTMLASEINGFENYQPDEESIYTTPRLLELDAALSVYSSLTKLKVTKKGKEISDQHQEIFNPHFMTDTYKDLYQVFLSLSMHIFGVTENSAPADFELANAFVEKATPIFIDIALAYPPPTYFENNSALRYHFEPGLRLIRILHAFQNMDVMPQETDSFLFSMDEVTRKTASFTYPSVKQIYEDWGEYFNNHDDDEPVSRWRKDLCERRALEPDSFAHRHIYNFLRHDLPLFIKMPGNTDDYLYVTKRLIGSEGDDLYWSLKANERDLSLIDLFLGLGNKRYCCPLASKSGQGTCKAQEEKCLTGLKEIYELPNSTECIVRSSLRSAGFNL